MNNVIQKDFIKLTEDLFQALYSQKNPQLLIQHLSYHIKSYGLLYPDKESSYDEICDYLKYLCHTYQSLDLQNSHFHYVTQTDELCIIDGIYELIKNKDQKNLKHYHLTIVYKLENTDMKIIHMHVSNPFHIKNDITLQHQQTDIQNIFGHSNMAGLYCCYKDKMHTYYYINDILAHMLGYLNKEEYLEAYHYHAFETIYHEDLVQTKKTIEQYLSYGDIYNVEYRMVKKDGSLIWVMEQGQRFIDEYNNELINAFISDISAIKKNELDLIVQKKKYSLALKDNSITILEYDIKLDRLIIDIQIESKKKIYDHYLDYVSSDRSTVFKEDRPLVVALFTRKIKGPIEIREHIRGTNQYVRKTMDSAIIYDEKGEPVIVLATARDITTEWNHKTFLERKVQRDSLTQLLNLESGQKKIEAYLKEKANNIACSLIILDIDYFKTINDNCGHLFGNDVLVAFAECLTSHVHKSDIVVRIGGDEFLILLKDIRKEDTQKKAAEICQAVGSLCFDNDVSITTSMGICYLDCFESCDFEDMFKYAYLALYKAKENGRNCFYLCDLSDMNQNQDEIKDVSFLELYNQMMAIIRDSHFIDHTKLFQTIGKHYAINRISYLTIDKEFLLYNHCNMWISSRSYQHQDIENTIDKKDLFTLCQHELYIIQKDEPNNLTPSFEKVLMQGVAKTVFLVIINDSQDLKILSYVHYEHKKDWTIKEKEELQQLSQLLIPHINKSK